MITWDSYNKEMCQMYVSIKGKQLGL